MDYQSEIHKLLGLGDSGESHINGAPHGLPVANHEPKEIKDEPRIQHNGHSGTAVMDGMHSIDTSRISFKSLIIYPVIFLMAFVFFYIVLNFSAIWAQTAGWFDKTQDEQILGADLDEYYKWIGNYFYAVGDRKLLEPTGDIDKDGLTNRDEFTMKSNPIVPDSDDDGFSDGIEVINSMNLWGSGNMPKNQKALAKKLDLIMINNRISGNVAQNRQGQVSGDFTSNYDMDRAGRLSIPRLNQQVPLIWSKDPSNFDHDLTLGVVHYPGTAMPGQNGIIYVSGHSSDYIWKKNPMANVFTKLNYLNPGDEVFVDVYGKDGKVYNYRYKVTEKKVYTADDQVQFIDNSNTSKLNLSTCWPIGTSKDRLVVTAEEVRQ
ncbi:MAG: sortase [Candidatus Doudnabacteria bacterium]|nr:sortase [Candidatus Doudnabacteria bacterium]